MNEILKNLMKQEEYWKIKSQLLELCLKNEKNEEEIRKIIENQIGSNQKLSIMIQNAKNSNGFLKKESFEFLNVYQEHWNNYLISQFSSVTQSFDMITSENEDEEIYFYDDQAFLHYLSKIKQDKHSNFENKMIQIVFPEFDIEDIEKVFAEFEDENNEKEESIKKYINNKGFENEICSIALNGLPTGLRSSVYIKYFRAKKTKNVNKLILF